MLRPSLLAFGVCVLLVGKAYGAEGSAEEGAAESKAAIVLGNAAPQASKVLSEFGFTLRPTPELPDAKLNDQAENFLAAARLHLQRVEAAFHSGRVEDAWASLAKAEKLLNSVWDRGFNEAVSAKLWRSGLAQASGDEAAANTAIAEALSMDPDLSVDLNRFWPSLADAVEAQRGQGQSVPLRLFALHPSSEVFVDGRLVPAESTVQKGEHRVMVRAPRRSRVTKAVTVDENSAFSFSQSFLHPEYNSSLSSEEASDRCEELLSEVCLFVGEYGSVLVEVRGGPDLIHRTRRKGDQHSWVRSSLRNPVEPSRSNWELHGGLVFGGLQAMKVSWGQSSLEMKTESSGIAGGATWHASPMGSGIFAGGAFSAQRTFEGTLNSTNLMSEVPERVSSSWHFYGQAQLGYQSRLGSRFALMPYLSTELFSTRFRDPKDEDGPLGVFEPVSFVSLAMGLRAQMAITSSLSLGLDGRFSALGITLESPERLGGEGDPGLGAFGGDIGWQHSQNLRVVFAVLLRQSPMRLSGVGSTGVSPQVENADIDLVSGEGTLKLYWRWGQ